MAHFEAVLTDIDGTAVDCEKDNQNIITRVAANHGGQIAAADWSHLAGTGDDVIWNWLKQNFSAFTVDKDSFIAEIKHGYLNRTPGAVAARGGISEIFTHVAARGIKLAAVTNSPRDIAMANLRNAWLDAQIPFVLTRCDVVAAGGKPKPSADPYLMAAQTLRVQPDRCIVLEDSRTGVTAARAAGMYVIQVVDHGADPLCEAHERAYDAEDFKQKIFSLIP